MEGGAVAMDEEPKEEGGEKDLGPSPVAIPDVGGKFRSSLMV